MVHFFTYWRIHELQEGGDMGEMLSRVSILKKGGAYIILWGAANIAALALYALPAVRLHCSHHHWCKLQACRVACRKENTREKCSPGRCKSRNLERHSNRNYGALSYGSLSDSNGYATVIPERPQSEQDTSPSDWPVFWFKVESPRQKSQ